MAIAEGVCTWTETATGKVLGAAKAINCAHCQRPVVFQNNRGADIGKGAHRNSGMDAKHDPGGRCPRCADPKRGKLGVICGPCADALARTLKCTPFEKRLEAMEGKRGLLAAAGVLIVLAIAGCGLSLSSDTHGVCGTDAAIDATPDAPPDAAQPCKAIVLTGDSNARGYGKSTELTGSDVELATPYELVDEFTRLATGTANPPAWTTYDWSPLQPRAYAGADTFGFELTMMRDVAEARPGYRWVLVKEAIGGTTLYDSWNPNTTSPWIFATVHDDIQAQLTAVGCTAAAYVNVLGGNDALQISRANHYTDRYPLFIDAIRVRWPGIPFVYGRLHDSTAYPYGAAVQAGQDHLLSVRTGVYEVDQSTGTLRTDGYHYTTASVVALGDDGYAVAVLGAVP